MKKLSDQEYRKRLKARISTIEVLSPYMGITSRLSFKCLICENIWESSAKSVLHRTGCPKCGQLKARLTKKWNLTTTSFIERLDPTFASKIEVLGEYLGFNQKIKVKCKICSATWDTKATNLVRKQGCSICGHLVTGSKCRKTHEEFVERVKKFHNGSIKVTSAYQRVDLPITFICLFCNKEQQKAAASNLYRRGCVYCNMSNGERKIRSLLEESNIKFVPEFSFPKSRLRFDFAILNEGKLSHLIEFNGRQHYEEVEWFGGNSRLKIQKENDLRKEKLCLEQGIKLIKVSYEKYSSLTISDLI